jgi:hypothetical protein
MKVEQLLHYLQELVNDGTITLETEISVPADPSQDYDRTSHFCIRTMIRNREILLVDPEDSTWQHSRILIPARIQLEQKKLSLGIIKHGTDVFGTYAKFLDWLNSPSLLFDGTTPIKIIKDSGEDMIETELTNIEHGNLA